MIYKVRIFDQDMNLKETISSPKLRQRFWDEFYEQEKKKTLMISGNKSITTHLKKELDLLFYNVSDKFEY